MNRTNNTTDVKSNLNEIKNIIHSFTSVHRYSNKTLIKSENIAEHSSTVGILILFLYNKLSNEDKQLINLDRTIAFSVFHDLDEIFTGDILNPVKYSSPDMKELLNEYSTKCINRFKESTGLINLLEYTDTSHLNDYEYCLLKLSDILSVYLKFKIENGLGNTLINADYSNIVSGLSNKSLRIFKNSPALYELLDHVIADSRIDCHESTDSMDYSNILKLDIK